MNIHPVIVHFPIALLTLYGIFELTRFRRINTQQSWFYIKAILVIFGSISAQAALGSGELVKDMFKEDNPLKHAIVPVHSAFADATTGVFLILATTYLILWIEQDSSKSFVNRNAYMIDKWNLAVRISRWIVNTPTSMILAFTGLMGLTITGALGGAMVHGPDVDPFVAFIYKLFF